MIKLVGDILITSSMIGLFLNLGCGSMIKMVLPGKFALKGLQDIQSFAIVYEKSPLLKMQPFDMLILEGEHYHQPEIRTLRNRGKTLLAYVNIGELETYRSFADQVPQDWLLKANPDWPEHYFVKPSETGWRSLLIEQIIPPLIDKGFDGFLFDSVDMASSSRFPEYKSAMVRLIKSIHNRYPEKYIILNNGQFLLDKLSNYVHGLLVEEVFTKVNEQKQHTMRTAHERDDLLNKLYKIKKEWDIPVFIVDYFPANANIDWKEIKNIIKRYGFVHYVTDIHAQKIYSPYNFSAQIDQKFLGANQQTVSK